MKSMPKLLAVCTLSVFTLVVIARMFWPMHQVLNHSKAAIEVCGEGNVWRVDTKAFECKPQDGAE